ncbi:hypothetical protein [Paenibacillus periandrae]|uniref:hypothetical protein n=1 Tax=Paenibacillus periandrae TaxID=1761741 RepID=UPI001F08C0F2|nr:hypothetical protein [Paenibacillus periandrae]
MEKQKSIILAAELFQEGRETSFTYFCSIPDQPYTDCLSTINLMGKTDKKAPGVLHGYTMRFTMPIEGVVLEFEATSILLNIPNIEIIALKIKNGDIVDELHTFVNPGIKIPKSVR